MISISYYVRRIIPLISYLIVFAVAFGATSILIYFLGYSLLEVYQGLLEGGFGNLIRIGHTLNMAAILLLCSLGLILAFKCGVWNIGAEGQLYMGAVGAALVGIFLTGIPRLLHLLLVAIASFMGGGIWGLIPGILKVKYKVNEIITTLLMNFIAIWFVTYLVEGPWLDPVASKARTELIAGTAKLPIILPGTAGHAGILIALGLAIVVGFILQKAVLGYRIKAIGVNPDAALSGGILVGKVIIITMILSGGLAGLAGMLQVSGGLHFLASYVSAGYGFLAIGVVWIARLNPLASVLASVLFGGLLIGGHFVEGTVGLDITIIKVLVPLIMLSLLLEPVIEERLSHLF